MDNQDEGRAIVVDRGCLDRDFVRSFIKAASDNGYDGEEIQEMIYKLDTYKACAKGLDA